MQAYERLASQPELSPLLVLTQQQLQLLAAGTTAPLPLLPRLPASPDLIMLQLHHGCSITVRDYVSWTEEAWAAAAAGATVSTVSSSSSSSSSSSTCTQPSAATTAASASAAEEGISVRLAVLALTGPLLQDLLQHHPHGGVRERLHAAGLLPKRQALLAALAALVTLRQEVAAARGWRSYAHMALQVRLWKAGAGACL
jgi:hypothetical protein